MTGDLTAPDLGITKTTRRGLRRKIDHLVHLAALYDMTADDERNQEINVEGTRRVVELAEDLEVGVLHHVSSVAVAGEARGTFAEKDFDEGQPLPSPYHRTKFESEKVVRAAGVPWRVYRPAIVLGDSRTGEMDKVDGPYYFFPTIDALARLPRRLRTPMVLPGLGDSNVVPVDYVVEAMHALMHRPGLDGRAFHLVHPRPQPLAEVYNAFAVQAGAPTVTATLPGMSVWPAAKLTAQVVGALPGAALGYELTLQRLGVPAEVVPHSVFSARFAAEVTRAELDAAGVPPPPELEAYAGKLWSLLDPSPRPQPRSAGTARAASSTAGSSPSPARRRGSAGRRRWRSPPAAASPCCSPAARPSSRRSATRSSPRAARRTSTRSTSPSRTPSSPCVKQMLADHGGVDMLVNNAGRSIRRSVALSYDRFHDYERTMALNYFAPVRLILALLPSMQQRRFGRIVNVSSIGVQTNVPRFSAYVASKAALDAFSRVVATETIGDGVTFSVIHMPLVRTPMIAPTTIYDRFPTMTPDEAADVLVHALEHHPKQWGTRLGTFGAVANALTPEPHRGRHAHRLPRASPTRSPRAVGDAGSAPRRPRRSVAGRGRCSPGCCPGCTCEHACRRGTPPGRVPPPRDAGREPPCRYRYSRYRVTVVERGATPEVPGVVRRVLSAARALTTPLMPDAYLQLLNPMWRPANCGASSSRSGARPTTPPPSSSVRTGPWPGHGPGQYLRVGVEIDGIRYWRAFTLTSDPGHPRGVIAMTVKKVDGGLMSTFLLEQADPGTLLYLGQVEGEFGIEQRPERPVLMISAGSGVTPMFALLRQLDRRDWLERRRARVRRPHRRRRHLRRAAAGARAERRPATGCTPGTARTRAG